MEKNSIDSLKWWVFLVGLMLMLAAALRLNAQAYHAVSAVKLDGDRDSYTTYAWISEAADDITIDSDVQCTTTTLTVGISGDADTVQLTSGNVAVRGDVEVDDTVYSTTTTLQLGVNGDTDTVQVTPNQLLVNGDVLVDGLNIGISADTDLMALAADSVTVNGAVTATGVVNIDDGVSPGITIQQQSGANSILEVVADDAATDHYLAVMSQGMAGTDDVGFVVYGKEDAINQETLYLKYDQTEFGLYTYQSAGGTLRPINIYTTGNADQLKVNTDGSVTMSGAVTATGDVTGDRLRVTTSTAALPAVTLTGDPNTGLNLPGSNTWGLSANGASTLDYGLTTASTTTITGLGTVTGLLTASADLSVTGDIQLSGDILDTGATMDIGVSGDADVVSLSSGAAQINGTLTVTGAELLPGADNSTVLGKSGARWSVVSSYDLFANDDLTVGDDSNLGNDSTDIVDCSGGTVQDWRPLQRTVSGSEQIDGADMGEVLYVTSASTITMPASPSVGERYTIIVPHATPGGTHIQGDTGETIYMAGVGNAARASSQYLSTSTQYGVIEVQHCTTNVWIVTSYVGTWAVGP